MNVMSQLRRKFALPLITSQVKYVYAHSRRAASSRAYRGRRLHGWVAGIVKYSHELKIAYHGSR